MNSCYPDCMSVPDVILISVACSPTGGEVSLALVLKCQTKSRCTPLPSLLNMSLESTLFARLLCVSELSQTAGLDI